MADQSANGQKTPHYRSDKELIDAFYCGDDDAFDILRWRYTDRIRSKICSKFHLPEEVICDIVQDTFISVFVTRDERTGSRYRHDVNFFAWLWRIAHNNCIDYYRDHENSPQPEDTFSLIETIDFLSTHGAASKSSTRDVFDQIAFREFERALIECVLALPLRLRQVIEPLFDESTGVEIAVMIGITAPGVVYRTRRATLMLRKCMKSKEHTV